jgi:hypothetical protein
MAIARRLVRLLGNIRTFFSPVRCGYCGVTIRETGTGDPQYGPMHIGCYRNAERHGLLHAQRQLKPMPPNVPLFTRKGETFLRPQSEAFPGEIHGFADGCTCSDPGAGLYSRSCAIIPHALRAYEADARRAYGK